MNAGLGARFFRGAALRAAFRPPFLAAFFAVRFAAFFAPRFFLVAIDGLSRLVEWISS